MTIECNLGSMYAASEDAAYTVLVAYLNHIDWSLATVHLERKNFPWIM